MLVLDPAPAMLFDCKGLQNSQEVSKPTTVQPDSILDLPEFFEVIDCNIIGDVSVADIVCSHSTVAPFLEALPFSVSSQQVVLEPELPPLSAPSVTSVN